MNFTNANKSGVYVQLPPNYKMKIQIQKIVDRMNADSREFPCEVCDDGEYIHKYTSPGYSHSIEVYRCNKCYHEVKFP